MALAGWIAIMAAAAIGMTQSGRPIPVLLSRPNEQFSVAGLRFTATVHIQGMLELSGSRSAYDQTCRRLGVPPSHAVRTWLLNKYTQRVDDLLARGQDVPLHPEPAVYFFDPDAELRAMFVGMRLHIPDAPHSLICDSVIRLRPWRSDQIVFVY